jgi:hypothetical protein
MSARPISDGRRLAALDKTSPAASWQASRARGRAVRRPDKRGAHGTLRVLPPCHDKGRQVRRMMVGPEVYLAMGRGPGCNL